MGTFLVTGGAGFIGSHLCRALLRDGHAVRVLDDLSTGSRDNLPAEVELIEGDIGRAETVVHALEGSAGCFHLAAIASVERGITDWVGTHRVNLTGTIVVLDAIRRMAAGGRAIPFVYASSAAVYGDSQALPLVEDARTRPLSAYGADKYACEMHAAVASEVHRVPTTGLRFFNVYGPRQDPRSPYSGVISIFCDRLVRGRPVVVFGDGHQSRDFIYVGDVVRALLRAMATCSTEPRVLNVCTGRPTTILDLVRAIGSITGREPAIEFNGSRAGEIRHSIGSPARARATFGLGEPTALGAGLAQVLAWLEGGAGD